MIGAYDFCGHYEWTFEWLRSEGGEELVHRYWEDAISQDAQSHARALIIPHGLQGMKRYWGPTLDEEGAHYTITKKDDVLRIDMHECPSKGFLLRNDLEQYHDYCDHCMGWIKPLMDDAGFHILHQHNHCGQCWWEMRAVAENIRVSPIGEVAGEADIRLNINWKGERPIDTFGHEPVSGASATVTLKSNEQADDQRADKQYIDMAKSETGEDISQVLKPKFCTALVTPLNDDDSLHKASLNIVIEQQLGAGVTGLLAGGTMGAMQLLPDTTYHDLMRESIRSAQGRCELLAGAGDSSFARTCERIEFLNTLPFDGVVVLAPYLMPFSQEELIEYYRALADVSRAPLFLYDLPIMTRTKLSLSTVKELAKHPNIAGIKCSDEPGYARQLCDMVDDDFRVILAAPTLMDVFLRDGYAEHLDGIYCLCPRAIKALGSAAMAGDWESAARQQRGINSLMQLLRQDEVWRPATAFLNHQGIPGHFKPRPHRDWDEAKARAFLETEEAQAVLTFLNGS